MKKNGFTLIELLAVIIILAVIALIATPLVINVVNGAKAKANQASIYGYADGLKLAVYDYMYKEDTFGQKPVVDKTWAEANMELNNKEVNCEGVFYSDTYSSVLNKCKVSDSEKEYCLAKGKIYECDNSEFTTILGEVSGGSGETVYKDPSGASSPNLSSNMIPIEHDGTNWVKADTSQEWYNYNKQQWANAVTVTEATRSTYKSAVAGTPVAESDILTYMVWIPRYKYKLFNANNESKPEQEIEIVFETKETSPSCGGNTCTTNRVYSTGTNGEYLTHPAFTFGTEELDGFWVGKFETTGTINTACTTETCTTANLTIKPNLPSVRDQKVSSMYYASRSMSAVSNNIYGYNTTTDTHMMKNMEWGAVAYLKQSKYGLGTTDIGINNYYNDSNYTTGCGAPAGSSSSSTCDAYNTTNGMLASTTGNIYGVYDMSGGAWEYAMGNMVNSNGAFQSSYAGFTNTPPSKYYDSYTYGTTETDSTAHARGLLGDATKETLRTFGSNPGGWYSDYSYFVYSTRAWFLRGGSVGYASNAGVFYFYNYNGAAYINYSWRLACR